MFFLFWKNGIMQRSHVLCVLFKLLAACCLTSSLNEDRNRFMNIFVCGSRPIWPSMWPFFGYFSNMFTFYFVEESTRLSSL